MIDEFVQRHVPFERCFNFRDIGGYRASDGRQVRWGRYFRAGTPHRMSPADLERARGLGLASVVDLRRPDEVRASGGRPPLADPPVQYHQLPVVPEGGTDRLNERFGHGISGRRYFGYLEAGPEYFRRTFELLAEAASYPLLVHCTAGKDRTGVVTALTLDLLGVDRATVEADFVLTNRDVGRQIERLRAEGRIPEGGEAPDLGVPEQAIGEFFELLDREYGSAAGFAESLGLRAPTIDAIVDALLEEPRQE